MKNGILKYMLKFHPGESKSLRNIKRLDSMGLEALAWSHCAAAATEKGAVTRQEGRETAQPKNVG